MERLQIIAALDHLSQIAIRLGDDSAASEAAELRDRVQREEFFVACIGQFKRGKSTLLDALLGDPVLPVGVTPVTAVPTVVRYGAVRSARVRESAGSWREIPVETLAAYVSEELNPGNQKGITAAEILEPAALLENGLCLVDTPGIGSVFEANTRATLAFVPQIDVVLAVIGTDPPISGDELRLIEDAARHTEHVMVVLNKADRDDPGDRHQACAFAKRVIEGRLGQTIGRILEVSATDQLNGLARWPDWTELVAALDRLAAESGRAVVDAAGERGVRRIRSRLIDEIVRMEWSLTAPLDASEEHIARLRSVIANAERTLDDLSAALSAQAAKLEHHFDERTRTFLQSAKAAAHPQLEERLRSRAEVFGPRLRRQAMADAQLVAARIAEEWLSLSEREGARRYESTMLRFAALAAEHWRGLRQSDVDALRELPDAEEIAATFVTTSQFRFNEQITVAQPVSPLRYGADIMLGAVGLRRVILADAHRFLDWLLELNVGRVESDMRERVRDGRKALEDSLRAALYATLRQAEVALERVKTIRDRGATAVAAELTRLRELRGEIDQ
jgi:predicted GTPase